MLVYVVSENGTPLMPTSRCGKVRRLLKDGLAKVIRRSPFTIQLKYAGTSHTQPVSLGVDAGSKHIGLSATTKKEVLYEADVTLRTDITELLSSRREFRRSRRNRKTRYRKARFLNRVKAKHRGWLAPSVEQKIGTHLKAVQDVCHILPVKRITVETAAFDTQLLKALEEGKAIPEGTDYQQGEQLGGWNVREYVLFRDGHTCRCCKGKSKDKILETHHIQSRKTGGDAPNNLVTLCRTCHKGYHNGTVKLPEDIRRGHRYHDAAFMGIMRWTFYNRLKEMLSDAGIDVRNTYGYLTKETRIVNGLSVKNRDPEDKYPIHHMVDARCISGNPKAEAPEHVWYLKKVRCHNRQIHKAKILKGGIRKKNQAPYLVKGFRLFDKVRFNGQEGFIFGRRSSGYFDIRTLSGKVIHRSASVRNLKLIESKKYYLSERRTAELLP